jgi:hypothetical protein
MRIRKMKLSLLEHSLKSIFHYRLTALYLVAGVAFTTAHTPFTNGDLSSTGKPILVLSSLRPDFGQPPILFFNVAYHSLAAWLSFLGVFWDVRRRMREWALIRLCGGHPSLVAGFQYCLLFILGLMIGGVFSFLAGMPKLSEHAIWQMTATSEWGFLFSLCLFAGPIAYTEFFDIVPVLRIEGDAR